MLSLPFALQALLYASGEPVSKKRVMAVLAVPPEMLAIAIKDLRSALAGTGLHLVETPSELELRTSPDAAPVIDTFTEAERTRDLGKASLETLAIILYRSGATRADIDRIRGVNSTAALRSLLLRGLIERTSDAEDKRRARYAITPEALAHLGLGRAEEAPGWATWSAALAEAESGPAGSDTDPT
jgi:segregation and condensation protein B